MLRITGKLVLVVIALEFLFLVFLAIKSELWPQKKQGPNKGDAKPYRPMPGWYPSHPD